jgi:hypothetical protein
MAGGDYCDVKEDSEACGDDTVVVNCTLGILFVAFRKADAPTKRFASGIVGSGRSKD